ncbi:anillin [Aulostomus maculatus]
MDPFTEKLLERTRARRENLQKKMAERPNTANRQMVKRPREPLADTNSVISEPVGDKVPPVSKPSPSKRRCSEENLQPAAGEENREPTMAQPVTPPLPDPPTDKKPPVGPASIRPTSSLEKTAARPVVQSQPGQLKIVQQEQQIKAAGPAPATLSGGEAAEGPALSAAGMKSRLQRLAEQRKCWDGSDSSDAVPDCTPLSLLKRQADVPLAACPPMSSGAPVGRRGRLANLAATIGSWEDDLSHANIPKETAGGKPGTTSVPRSASRDTSIDTNVKPKAADREVTGSAASSKSTSSSSQAMYSPVKSSRVVPPSPQRAGTPPARSVAQSVTSPLKNAVQAASGPLSSTAVPQSPLKNQAPSRSLNVVSSPHKPDISAKPTFAGPSLPQEKASVSSPVKTFAERFGERCQERLKQSTPAGGAAQPRTFTVTPSVTPNTRLVQDRLRAAQTAKTTTADLTQRQKMERESELAQIRSRFQKGNNMWKNREDGEETKKPADIQDQPDKPVEGEAASCEPTDGPRVTSTGNTETPTKCPLPGPGLVVSPPASASSPLRGPVQTSDETPDDEEEAEGKEVEMNVDQSINSAVINELFDGVLEQSEDQEDDEEEDALNISSMSLLTPLAETVAAVVKSPERRMMTSTPASSFIVKSNTPDSKLGNFQRANKQHTGASDEDLKLPYSIDAYRSTRVKETERPSTKQMIVRKEDVSNRAEEPRSSSLFSIKQKMKILANEVNLQQTVIHQASQALNCCTDEEHGKGSQVEAEAERLLLVATERREALKAELDRLKGEGPAAQKKTPATPEPTNMSASKGSITLQELRLPLKADFVCSTANRPESTKHSFFIMIRAGAENTVATQLASTHRGLSGDTLTFPTKFTLSDVTSDFDISIEVYCLVQKREACSDKKKKPSKSKIIWRQVHEAHDLCMSAITPKRFLAISKSSHTPVVASPGGPNAVRTSNFILVGSHKLTLSSIGKSKFPLEKVPFLCPLEGHVYLRMQCEVGSKVEGRGFLTMFEDVSGFGAWHRRWCVLSGYCISYWTYPDDEKRKNPIGRINLANCTSKRVEPVNREFCARPHTLELITVRPQREDDRETLVSQCKNTMCVTKNWLSADTKDERNVWMTKLNQILVDLRMWQPDACCGPL